MILSKDPFNYSTIFKIKSTFSHLNTYNHFTFISTKRIFFNTYMYSLFLFIYKII